MKKGQISYFIIGGMVLILLALLFTSINRIPQSITPSDLKLQASEYIDFCLEDSVNSAILWYGSEGRILHQKFMEDEAGTIEYYYHAKTDHVPTLLEAEQELEDAIAVGFEECLVYQDELPFDIGTGKSDVDVIMTDEKTVVFVNFPVSIISNDRIDTFTEHSYSLDASIKPFLESSSAIVNAIIINDPWFDLSMLLDIEQDITLIPYDENTLIFQLKDPLHKIGGEDYEHYFAIDLS